jgi:hypothetical protein
MRLMRILQLICSQPSPLAGEKVGWALAHRKGERFYIDIKPVYK